MSTSTRASDAIVVGGGIIGAAVAWRAVEAGLTVTLLDPSPGDGATHAAAGMLAPVSESWFGESALSRLGVAGLVAWPRFARDLERVTGLDVGLRETGTLVAAYDVDDVAHLRRWLTLHTRAGVGPTELTGTEARRREPLLGHQVAGAAWVPGDHVADPRTARSALSVALHAHPGAAVVPRTAVRIERDRGAAVGVHDDAGTLHRAGAVVLAAGWRSGELADVPVRPVRGQTLRLDAPPGTAPEHVVRGRVQGRPVYVVPRPPGTGSGPGTTAEHREVVVGATSEEGPDDRRPSAGGVFALLRDARALVPALDEAAFVEATLRARPTTPDNLPLVGPSGTPGLHLATGHHRGGVLLAPLTAEVVVAGLTGTTLTDATAAPAAAADPRRFSSAAHPLPQGA